MPARERGVGLVDRVKATERVRERERERGMGGQAGMPTKRPGLWWKLCELGM